MDESGKQPVIAGYDDGNGNDEHFSNSEFLTREEVLNCRLRRVKKLVNVYRDYYWALMEDLRSKHREYYMKYGRSPFEEQSDDGGKVHNLSEKCADIVVNFVNNQNDGENLNSDSGKLGLGTGTGGSSFNWCEFQGCKSKAMALTKYCCQHILKDERQKLYKSCNFVMCWSELRPLLYCDTPILRSIIPSFCPRHLPKIEKQVSLALKKAGLTASSSTKFNKNFHVLVSEYVNQIQNRRRVAKKANTVNMQSVKVERPE